MTFFCPDFVFFVLSCIVSVVSIVVKAMLFFTKIRTRDIAHKIGKRRATIGGVDISSELSDNEAVKELKARFDEHRMEQRRFVRARSHSTHGALVGCLLLKLG